MKQLITVVSWVLLGVLGWIGDAQAVTKQCDRCSLNEMNLLAGQNLAAMRYSPLYVIDARGGVVRKYVRRTNQGPGFDPEIDVLEVWAELASVEPSVSGHIQQASVYYAAMGNETVVVNVDPNLPVDAHQAISRTDLDGPMSNYIRSHAHSNALNQFVVWLDSYMGGLFDPTKISAIIEVIYQDGSRARYKYDRNTDSYKREPKTSRDKNGNLIPEAPGDSAGITYVFKNADADTESYDDFVDMFNRLASQGVTITDGRSGTGSGIGMVCTAEHCVIVTIQY